MSAYRRRVEPDARRLWIRAGAVDASLEVAGRCRGVCPIRPGLCQVSAFCCSQTVALAPEPTETDTCCPGETVTKSGAGRQAR